MEDSRPIFFCKRFSCNENALYVCTAALPKIPHPNSCKRVPNRPLRGRRGRFGTLLQLLECGIFGRAAVVQWNRLRVVVRCGPRRAGAGGGRTGFFHPLLRVRSLRAGRRHEVSRRVGPFTFWWQPHLRPCQSQGFWVRSLLSIDSRRCRGRRYRYSNTLRAAWASTPPRFRRLAPMRERMGRNNDVQEGPSGRPQLPAQPSSLRAVQRQAPRRHLFPQCECPLLCAAHAYHPPFQGAL